MQISKFETISDDLKPFLEKTSFIIRSYLAGIGFIVRDTGRDPAYFDSHLLSYLINDLTESSVAVLSLSIDGAKSVAKRELRFMIETSLKICFIQQKNYESSIEEKLVEFHKILSSQKISIKKEINLHMLSNVEKDKFDEDFGRLYGELSDLVHLSPKQISDRISEINLGSTLGNETEADVEKTNLLISQALSMSLVLLLHAVPEWVAGDWLVNQDGSSQEWYFKHSKFIASIDSYFDYKHERKTDLLEIQKTRVGNIIF